MRLSFLILLLGCMIAAGGNGLNAQEKPRPPAVAGAYYAADPDELKRDLEFLFSRAALPATEGSVRALIVPHAGYPFSGEVAASAYAQIDPEKDYKNIFILGSSHHYAFEGAAVYSSGNFLTPLGEVPVNLELARELTSRHGVFLSYDAAHLNEHSLEVQLPFLQYRLKKNFRIVPILLGTRSEKICRQIAGILRPYMREDNLFVISTDLSHYPDYRNANIVDRNTTSAMITGDPEKFLEALAQNEVKNIPNLATSACAWPSVLTLMYMTREAKEPLEYELVRYRNSGDTRLGDKSSVVGYAALRVYCPEETGHSHQDAAFMLSQEDKSELMEIARSTLDSYIRHGRAPSLDGEKFSSNLNTHTGAFVTLHKDGKLRGCIGRFQPDIPLYEVVRDMTISASTRDYRFKPVESGELDDIELEISVLTPMVKVSDPSEIVLGKHGIYLKKGPYSGTFLPQVATQTGWNLEEFLGHCARDKAQIGWYGWKDAELYIYEALVFTEKDCQKP